MKFGKGIILSGVLIFFALFSIQAKTAAYDINDKKAVLVVVDRISFEDVQSLTGFREISGRGAIALMNNRSSGAYSACKAYVSIGSGARAEGTSSAVGAVEVDEYVGDMFYGRTGKSVTRGMVVNPFINKLISQNENGEYGAIAGSMGHYLRQAGLRTAVLGNADSGDTQIRWAVSIAMDRNGIVDYGVVGEEILRQDQSFPTGQRTDFPQLIVYLEQMLQKADFIVIETGDLTRIEESRDMLNAIMYQSHRHKALLRIDEFLTELKRRADLEDWLLIIATPYPSEEEIARGARLTPLIVYGGEFSPGLLTSGTTRREGIVGSMDIAPTVLDHMGIDAQGLTGRPLRAVERTGNLERVKQINATTVSTSNYRYPILYNYAIFVILVVLTGLFTVLYPSFMKGILVLPEELALIFITVFPVVLLVLPLFGINTLTGNAAAAVIGTAGLSFATHRYIKDLNRMFLFLSGVTALFIIFDIITGGSMIQRSVLGYDPIIGARYYGIGNEYMGILAGSAIIAACSLLEQGRAGLRIIVPALGIVVVVVGYPGWGANLGGAITCLWAFVFFALRIKGVRIGARQVAGIGLVMIAVISAFLLLDMVFLKDHSHLAAAVGGAAKQGPLHIFTIIQRKAAMNFKLLRYTVWTKVLITVITVTGVLFYRPVGIFMKLFAEYPHYAKGWSALVVAAAVGMAVNDSGVVTSATSSIFFVTSMLYILIKERKIPKEPAVLPGKGHGI